MLMIIPPFVSHPIETFVFHKQLLSNNSLVSFPPVKHCHSAIRFQCHNLRKQENSHDGKFSLRAPRCLHPLWICRFTIDCTLCKSSNYHRSHERRKDLVEASSRCWAIGWSSNPQSAAHSQEKCSIFFWTGGIYPGWRRIASPVGGSVEPTMCKRSSLVLPTHHQASSSYWNVRYHKQTQIANKNPSFFLWSEL